MLKNYNNISICCQLLQRIKIIGADHYGAERQTSPAASQSRKDLAVVKNFELPPKIGRVKRSVCM